MSCNLEQWEALSEFFDNKATNHGWENPWFSEKSLL